MSRCVWVSGRGGCEPIAKSQVEILAAHQNLGGCVLLAAACIGQGSTYILAAVLTHGIAYAVGVTVSGCV